MKNFNFTDPLPAGFSDWFVYDTAGTEKPLRVEAYAANCGTSFAAGAAIY